MICRPKGRPATVPLQPLLDLLLVSAPLSIIHISRCDYLPLAKAEIAFLHVGHKNVQALQILHCLQIWRPILQEQLEQCQFGHSSIKCFLHGLLVRESLHSHDSLFHSGDPVFIEQSMQRTPIKVQALFLHGSFPGLQRFFS